MLTTHLHDLARPSAIPGPTRQDHPVTPGIPLSRTKSSPGAAFDALLQRVVDLAEEPWDAAVMPPGKDPAYRMTVFGAGYGLLTFHADDASEIIRIFDIIWIG
jgi:hypothetical protein